MTAPFNPEPGPDGYQQDPYRQQQTSAPTLTHAEARAQAKGAKAQAKALRPWYKKKRYLIPLILLVILLLTRLGGGGGDNSSGRAVPADPAPAKTTAPAKARDTSEKEGNTKIADAPKIGTPVKAGDWQFTVTKITCGVKKVGDQYLGKKAQGQFCLLSLKVKNNGDEAGTMVASNQKLLDKQGRTYSSDNEASIYADTDAKLFEQINPGNTLKGLIVFDIPKQAKPVQATLAGGLFGIKDVATVDLA